MKLTESLDTKVKGHFVDADDEGVLACVPFLVAGKKNANGRTYSVEVVKKAVDALKEIVGRRKTYGSTKHQKELELDLVSHFIEDVDFDPTTNTAQADLRIVKTTKGKNLLAILRAGGRLGVSARGEGAVDEKGAVKSGYKITGIDFCLDPAFGTFASKANMFESCSVAEDPNAEAIAKAQGFGSLEELNEALAANVPTEQDPERILRLKFITARQAGYQGDFAAFMESFNRTASDDLVEQKFDEARQAGYKGDFKSFKELLKKGK